ncbi:Os01g0561950, partial [Oryza sativa Japonica Group]
LRSSEHDDEGGDDDGDGRSRAGKIVAAEPRHVPVAPRPAVARHVLVQPRERLRVVVHRVDVAQAVEEPRRLLVVVQQVLHHAAPPEQLDIARRHDELAHQRHVAAQEPGHLAALALLERDQVRQQRPSRVVDQDGGDLHHAPAVVEHHVVRRRLPGVGWGWPTPPCDEL